MKTKQYTIFEDIKTVRKITVDAPASMTKEQVIEAYLNGETSIEIIDNNILAEEEEISNVIIKENN